MNDQRIRELLKTLMDWKEAEEDQQRNPGMPERDLYYCAVTADCLHDVISTIFHLWKLDGETFKQFTERLERES